MHLLVLYEVGASPACPVADELAGVAPALLDCRLCAGWGALCITRVRVVHFTPSIPYLRDQGALRIGPYVLDLCRAE